MRHLRLVPLGLLLLAFMGCGKTEPEKTAAPEKTAGAGTEQPKANTGGAASLADAKDFSMVPQNAVLLASVRPSEGLGSAYFKSLPFKEQITERMAEMKQEMGFDATNIARVSVALWPGDGNVLPGLMDEAMPQGPPPGALEKGPAFPEQKLDEVECDPQPGNEFQPPPQAFGNPLDMVKNFIPKVDGAVFVQFNSAVDLNQLVQKIPERERPKAQTVDGLSLQLFSNVPVGGGIAAWQPNPNMVVMTFQSDVKDITKNSGTSELAAQALAAGANATASFQLSFAPLQGLLPFAMGPLQGQIPDSENLPKQLKSLSLFVALNDGADVNLLLDTTDPSAVKNIKAAFDQHYKGLEGQVQMASQSLPPGTNEEIKTSAQALAQEVYDSVKSEAKGNQYRLSLRVPPKATEVIAKVTAEQEKLMRGKNNLKQIGIAAHNFHEQFNNFPFPAGNLGLVEANHDKLSWRVHLLPFLDQPLYHQFKLNEPWDSPHNKALIDKMPDVFRVSEGTKPGHTQFVAPQGMGFFVNGEATAKTFRDLTDGTSNTIMVLTVAPDKAEPWTKPGGFELDPAKAAEILGGHPAGFLALFADGSVHTLPGSIEPDTLKALLTIAGGEPVSPYDLER